MESPSPTSVRIPGRTAFEPVPASSGNLFSFIFSNPFQKGSRIINEMPKSLRHKCLDEVIPISRPIFRDGLTGSQLSYGRLRSDALLVASSMIHGPLQLRPVTMSSSDMSINRGSLVSPLVLLHLPNCLQYVVLAFGTLAAGLTISGANPALTPTELAHILTLSKPSVLVTTKEGLINFQKAFDLLSHSSGIKAELNYPSKGNVFIVDLSVDDYGPSDAGFDKPASWEVNGWKVQDWKVLLPSNKSEHHPFSLPLYVGNEDSLRAAAIFWSSGTSGKSKGVILSHRALGSALVSFWHGSDMLTGLGVTVKEESGRRNVRERLVAVPPFYHIFGCCNILLPGPAYGVEVTILQKFIPQEYLRIVQEIRATTLHIAPPIAVLLAKSPLVDDYDLSSVEGCTSGGAPLGQAVIEQVYQRLGILIKMGYGLSEACGVTGQAARNWDDIKNSLGCAGPAFPGNELKIIGITSGKTASVQEEGEILIRSNSVFTAYLNNPEATSESLDDEGWFHTGDVGKIDVNGNLWIVDRLKEIIKVKGFQVSPADLEDGLCACPLVQDAGVTSIYHEDHATEYPRAYVVPVDKSILPHVDGTPKSEDSLKKAYEFAHQVRVHIEAKSAPYKWIRGGIVIVEAVPKSPTGKILRRLLKDTKGHLIHVYEDKNRAKL